MSTLNVANVTDGTTTVSTNYVVNGSAKAWVNFNGTGTIAARDSLNLSSLTDNGTGDYTVNLSNNMSNGNYNYAFSGMGYNGPADPQRFYVLHATTGNITQKTTSAIRMSVGYIGAATDTQDVNALINGGLA